MDSKSNFEWININTRITLALHPLRANSRKYYDYMLIIARKMLKNKTINGSMCLTDRRWKKRGRRKRQLVINLVVLPHAIHYCSQHCVFAEHFQVTAFQWRPISRGTGKAEIFSN